MNHLKAVDHVKREGQVTTPLKIACVVFSVSFQAVVFHTKTLIDHRVFFIKSELSGRIKEIPTVSRFRSL